MQMTLANAIELSATLLPDGAAPPVVVPPPVVPQTQVTEVLAQGFQALHADTDAFDPAQTLIVRRVGFDQTGAPAQYDETLALTTRVRQPHPDHATLSADRVALADFVYAGDVVAGVTNNSTRTAPAPIAMWLNHDLEWARATTHTLRLAVAHGHARGGSPVAAVKFIASDGAMTVEQIVSAMEVAQYAASGLSVPHYAAEMDLSTLQQGALLTIDAVIYPWVGAAFTISQHGDPYPSPNLTTLRLLNDGAGSYGTVFAYVDATAGDNATAVASGAAATAQAAPFATVSAAASAAVAVNGSLNGRAHNSGVVIRLEPGVHTHSGGFRGANVAGMPLVLEAADPAAVATTVFQDRGSSLTGGIPRLFKVRNLTLRKTAGNVIFLDNGGNDATSKLIVENCIWDANGTSDYAAWVYRTGLFWQIDCTGYMRQSSQFGVVYKRCIGIGCRDAANGSGMVHLLGCAGEGFTPHPDSIGTFAGWNFFSRGSGVNRMVGNDSAIGPRGFALVGNIIESWGSHTDPTIQINADGNVASVENLVMMHNTAVGERLNLLYLDGSENVEKSAYVRSNVFELINTKGDVFAGESANTGNWAVRYKTGWAYNAALSGSNNGTSYSPASWLGEIASEGEVYGIDPVWADDRSNEGSGAGGGDYTPQAGTQLPLLPADLAAYPVDLFGRSIGTAPIGAAQPV
jgi:hypothetical protein